MYVLRVKSHFDAAHFLPWHEGKCKNLHGHRWEVEVEIEDKHLNSNRIVIDFGVVERILKKVLPDHTNLNETFSLNPTAEVLAYTLYHRVKDELEFMAENAPNVAALTVWESPNCSITYRPEE